MRHSAACCLIAGASLFLSSCGFQEHGFLSPSGPIAATQRDHLFSITGWTLVVIVPLFIATPIVLWKYRHSKKDAIYRPDWDSSWILEGVIWGLPLIIVAILSWNVWTLSHKLDPYRPLDSNRPALHIQVVSLDWKWLFIYTDHDIASVNHVVFPVDRPVHFELTSETVMQSFMIPRLGGQIYTMPAMTTQLYLLATERGTYRGLNTQYNGKSFAKQKFTAEVMSESDFKHWIKQLQSRPRLGMQTYSQLAQRSVLKEPAFFGSVKPNLFDEIVTRVKTTPAAALPGSVKPNGEGG